MFWPLLELTASVDTCGYNTYTRWDSRQHAFMHEENAHSVLPILEELLTVNGLPEEGESFSLEV